MSFKIIAVVRSDGRTEGYGPYPTREQAEKRADRIQREAKRNAPFLSPETNAAFNVKIVELPDEAR